MSVLLADIDATCAALGYKDGQKYQAEPDAIQGLKHLIWILRRDLDNHEYRRHLGRAKVLQTDLVYMLIDYINDDEYADVLIRLLVILTNPTLLLYRDGPPKDNHSRKVFLELIEILQCYKNAFTSCKIWSALFDKLRKSLEIDWALRSEEQNLLVERILVLMRNVLQVPASPEAECRADNDASVHDQVIWALHQAGILDLLLFIISSTDEHQFHLHCLEIVCLLYREQTAANLAEASLQRSISEKQRDEQELLAARSREKQKQSLKAAAGRHSRFGGTFIIRNLKSVSDRDIICHQALERVEAIDFDREKQQQKRSHRHVKEELKISRRSAFSVRLCLREYCVEILRSAYNTLVRQVRRVLERNSGSTGHDDSYLLWLLRFFLEFNRLSDMKLELVSESLSVQCFHWVLMRIQHDMDMIVSDKKQARVWAKRLHVAVQAFRELLRSLLALQKLQDDSARALLDMLLNNVCYVLEYRETILHLLMNYNEAHSTKAFLSDVVETANMFIKMMEKFCKDSVVVQDKKRIKKHANKKSKKLDATPEETEEELSNRWTEVAGEISHALCNELQIAEEDQIIPFDSTSDKPIDDQREDCMIKIHKMLRTGKLEHGIALMRAAREVWPENEVFGAMSAAPEDELLLLREIFMHNITTVDLRENLETEEHKERSDVYDDEIEEFPDDGMVEKVFKFDDFAKRLLNPKIVRACVVVLSDWEQLSAKSLKAAVTILHHIAYGCSSPALLYQAKLFRIFQQVFHAASNINYEELRRLGVYIVRKFVETAPKNSKIYSELLFYKSIKEANELENGYCDAYESGTKGTWSEEEECELRFLFEENQRKPETDKDVIDWLLENITNKTRTKRGVLKKLKEMGLKFMAPTKKSTTNMHNQNLWRSEEDEELQSLYDQYRTEDDCLQRIINEFGDRRNKHAIIRRMLQLHIIADKSEILMQIEAQRDHAFYEYVEAPGSKPYHRPETSRKIHTIKSTKVKTHKMVGTPLDVDTVRALLNLINAEKYQKALNWLKECLYDAADGADESVQEDDGVPLVPLEQLYKEAMEDKNFLKLLLTLGIQPPVFGMESYWRIPIYLNSSDLKLRAKIVAGERIEIDSEDFDLDNNVSGNESISDISRDYNGDEYESKKLENMHNYVEQQRDKIKSLVFNNSNKYEDRAIPNTEHENDKDRKKYDEFYIAEDGEIEGPIIKKLDSLKNYKEVKLAQKNMSVNKIVGYGNERKHNLNFNSKGYPKLLAIIDNNENDEVALEYTHQTGSKSFHRSNVIESDSNSDENLVAVESRGDDNIIKFPKKRQRRRSDDGNYFYESDQDNSKILKCKRHFQSQESGKEPHKRRRIVIDSSEEDD